MSENYTLINWQNGEVTQPAVVEIDGVEYQVQPAIETGNTPMTADNLNHMDNGIRNATLKLNDKIETATIKLIAVSATAPAECVENDKYYNTNTNLIYTATGTDTWGTTGEQPSTLYTYMNTYNKKIYYYDGISFSEYGGGSSSLVIHDSYNTSTTEPYSCNYINNLNTYSTTEHRIGTYMDKPLYRRLFETDVITSGETIVYTKTVEDIKMINGWFFRDSSGNNFIVPIGSYSSNESTATSRVFSDNTYIKVQANTNFQNNNLKARIIIEYTKTTD